MLIRLTIEKLKGNTNLITWKHMQEIEDLVNTRPANSIVDLPGKVANFLSLILVRFVSHFGCDLGPFLAQDAARAGVLVGPKASKTASCDP